VARFLISLMIVCIVGCQDAADNIGSSDDPVEMVEADDAEMAAAEQKARDTLDDFIKALQNPSPTQSDFGVKHAFKDGDTVEHMWITDLTYEQGTFSGQLGNDPGLVKNISNGDPVKINRSEVEDWLYFDGEDMIGGYTAKLLISRQEK
jgi:uncharacterized protein YegJ (DUF2314 family)